MEQVGEDGGGQVGGEVDECGAAGGAGADAELAKPGTEPGGGQRPAGLAAGEQPWAWFGGTEADAGAGGVSMSVPVRLANGSGRRMPSFDPQARRAQNPR